jgi:hypothetical protein
LFFIAGYVGVRRLGTHQKCGVVHGIENIMGSVAKNLAFLQNH